MLLFGVEFHKSLGSTRSGSPACAGFPGPGFQALPAGAYCPVKGMGQIRGGSERDKIDSMTHRGRASVGWSLGRDGS